MNNTIQKTKIALLASSILLSLNVSFAQNAEDRYIYIGTELGLSEPVIKSFDHDGDAGRANMRLKQSKMYGGRIGYGFYPGMMVELSITHQPKFRLGYRLPEFSVPVPGAGSVNIPETSGQTNVTGQVITLNLIYGMQEKFVGMNPYVIIGAGVAKVSIKPTSSATDRFAALGLGDKIDYFRINKTNNNCFAWQIGGGLTKDIGENFSIDLGAKIQVVNDIKIKYDTLSGEASAAASSPQYSAAAPIKKTISVGEFTLGFTFKIPV